MFKNYNYLGFHNPYYIQRESEFIIKADFESIYDVLEKEAEIDLCSVIGVLNRKFMLGDRTIIKEVRKVPWMARPALDNSNWLYSTVPNHGERILPEEVVADELFTLIQKEIREYVAESKRVGVLLSGGMDSRIVAGTLDYLICSGKLKDIQVTALTWGIENSRDVVYAKQIAQSLNWNWKHYAVTAVDLMRNIEIAAVHGSEYSPVHLHAMPQIREEENIDCILAGSFGDSIGRGEYSGRKVINLRNIASRFKNVGYLINSKPYQAYISDLFNDIQMYHDRFPQMKLYQLYEQDYQIHYMRRMLNSCMSVINEKIPLYQVFTKPEVFGFMWSLSPEVRSDSVYNHLLGFLNSDLRKIPWSRTGLIYGATGKQDNFLRQHHKYYEMISGELLNDIKDIIFSSRLFELGIFNKNAINSVFKALSIGPKEDSDFYAERIIWLASLSKTIDRFEIVNNEKFTPSLIDYINGLIGAPFSYFQNLSKKKVIRYIK